MSDTAYLKIQEQSDDFRFDDIELLNADLLKTEIGEYDEEHGRHGRLFTLTDRSVGLVDLESGREGKQTSIWSLFDHEVMKIVAGHVASGSLVMSLEYEQEDARYLRFTKGSCEKVTRPSGWVSA